METESALTFEDVMAAYPMTNYGPSWVVGDDSQFILPEHTLGWECLLWTLEYLRNPNDPDLPWQFTPEQARLVLWAYAVDGKGNRLTKKGMIQRAKGWGKDPMSAAICLFELVGPSQFSHFGEDGMAKGKPHPMAWVQLAATNADQNKNTLLLLPAMLPKSTIDFYKLEVQKQQINVTGTGKKLEAISSNFRGNEGNRATFALMNEVHHWIPSQGGKELYEVLRNNVQKGKGWFLAITNAYLPGEGSVAETMRETVIKEREGLAHDTGWFYDSLEANPDAPMSPEYSVHILRGVYGDSHWVPIETIAHDSLLDTSVAVAKLRRMFYNQVVASDDALFSEADLEKNWVDDDRLQLGDEIVLGFDGGKTDDATALVAIRVRDRLVQAIDIWQAPDTQMAEKWQINVGEVDSRVHMCFREFKVRAFFADVALWESSINSWADDYRETLLVKASPTSTIGFDMRGNTRALTTSNEELAQMVIDGKQPMVRDPLLRRHMLNARRRENQYGISFQKESRESKKKVDAYSAMLLAHMALQKYLESGRKAKPERDNTLYIF